MLDQSIFKAYDVRGTYPDQMDERLAYRIGRAFPRVLAELQGGSASEQRVAVGRDMRLSAPSMTDAYARGIADEGAHVLDVGMAIEHEDVSEAFREAALGYIDPSSVAPMRVVLDGGNGMAGPMVGPLLDSLPIERVETYWQPNGEFPDHEPNPLLEENRRFVIKRVRNEGADLGVAWDGDADRCFFIDDSGEFVAGDFLTALLAEALLRKEPGATILYDVRASRAVRDVVERDGGKAEVNRVGHAFFKSRMRETGAAFGGEVSGHYYFRDFYCADSGTIPALLILELLSVEGKRMTELLEPLRSRYFISGEINSEVSDQDAKMEEVAERYSDGEQNRLDGISVDYVDWHFNVRPSNTEPLLRLNLESLVSQEDMEAKRDEVLGLIRS